MTDGQTSLVKIEPKKIIIQEVDSESVIYTKKSRIGMIKIALIKSESDGTDKFSEELKKNDFSVQLISSISFKYKNHDDLCEKLRKHRDYDGIVFTSPRAIYCALQAFKCLEEEILNFWKLKESNFTVGDGTEKLANELLSMKTKGKEAGNATKLSSIIIDDYSVRNGHRKLLFPCGNLRQKTLEENLLEQSIVLDTLEVYETIQHEGLEDSIRNLGNVEYIAFFSPSSVNLSVPLFQKHVLKFADFKIIAIGPSTEKSLKDNNIECYGTCKTPTVESLIKILQGHS